MTCFKIGWRIIPLVVVLSFCVAVADLSLAIPECHQWFLILELLAQSFWLSCYELRFSFQDGAFEGQHLSIAQCCEPLARRQVRLTQRPSLRVLSVEGHRRWDFLNSRRQRLWNLWRTGMLTWDDGWLVLMSFVKLLLRLGLRRNLVSRLSKSLQQSGLGRDLNWKKVGISLLVPFFASVFASVNSISGPFALHTLDPLVRTGW